ncbi:MAG TPA: LysR substrate-binding domain-containing protein [Sphingomicrobium sp.]|nr:LysR substrate-binding domain-containing protein [Sphingomicrobium sp.]
MMDRARLKGLPLGGLLAFEAAARRGSFKAAASERSVTPAAISQQVKLLELSLGTLLFERANRSLRLTPVGRRLAARCASAFLEINRELDDLRQEGAIGSASVAVSAAPTFATKWLAPRLQQFLDRNPIIDVRLNAENEIRSPGRDPHADLALRYGSGPYGNHLAAEPVWDQGLVVAVCSPTLLPCHPAPPHELITRNLLRVDLPAAPGATSKADWRAWAKAAQVGDEGSKHSSVSGPIFGNHNLAIEAAASGRGIVLAPLVLLMDDLQSGRLVLASTTFLTDPNRFWILYARARETASIRAFVRWVKSEASLSAEAMKDYLANAVGTTCPRTENSE